MKKVLVTGGGGFIGARVVRQLLASEYEVGVISRPGSRYERLDEVAANIKIFTADLADRAGISAAVNLFRPDRCIHLAWYAEPGHYLHSRENLAAVSQSLNLLDALIESGCRQVVFAGTCAECDPGQMELQEDGATAPSNLYAASKISLFLMAREIAKRADIRLAWGRVFYLYGPGEDARRVVPALVTALLTKREFLATAGNQIRDYLHVDDVAAAFVSLADGISEGIYHIASGQGVSMRELMETVGRITGSPELIKFGARAQNDWDPLRVVGNNARLRANGWHQRWTLVDGLAETVEWWSGKMR